MSVFKKSAPKISDPYTLLAGRIKKATSELIPQLKEAMVEAAKSRAVMTASSTTTWTKKAEELRKRAVDGDARALESLTEAGGPQGYIDKNSAMHSVHQQLHAKLVRKNLPLWKTFVEKAEIATGLGEQDLRQEYLAIRDYWHLPEAKVEKSQFINVNGDEGAHPAYEDIRRLRQSIAHFLSPHADNQKGIENSPILSLVFK